MAEEVADASITDALKARSVVTTVRWRFQRAMCLVVGPLFRLVFGLRAINPPRLEGGFILAPNHTSFLDPMVLQLCFRRHITFLMDGDIYRNRFIGFFFRFWRAIPIPNNARVVAEALKEARVRVHDGQVVAIFPEGRISRDGALQDGMQGVALLMLKTCAPVVPVAIFGTYDVLPRHARFLRWGRLMTVFGEPIQPPVDVTDKKEAARILRDRVMAAIAELQERHAPAARRARSGMR